METYSCHQQRCFRYRVKTTYFVILMTLCECFYIVIISLIFTCEQRLHEQPVLPTANKVDAFDSNFIEYFVNAH